MRASSLSPVALLPPAAAASPGRAAARAPLCALPARLTPVPTVPAMARPAMPASAISLSALPEPTSAGPAAALAAVSVSVGSVYAMGFTAGVATVHVGGTDNAPTVLASPSPADSAVGVGTGPVGQVEQRRRERLDRCWPFVRPGLFARPNR